MDIFSKNRLMGWLVVILIALNLGMLITFWVTRPGGPAPDGRIPEKDGTKMDKPIKPGEFLETELGFNDEQKGRYKVMREAHKERADEILKDRKKLKDSFFEFLSQPDADSNRVTEIANEIGRNQTELDLLTFNHFKEVRAICTDEQVEKFDDIIGEVLRSMGRPKVGPPGDGAPGKKGPPPGR